MNRIYLILATVYMLVLVVDAQQPGAEAVREFKVSARKYEFSPRTIKVKRGDRVRLILMATDRDHGFKLDAFHIERQLPKGEAVTVEFTADQSGSFPFHCSHFCGIGHARMAGQLVVE
jgi:heme/copper-type cytochrome/quinol oxidase subunit 2